MTTEQSPPVDKSTASAVKSPNHAVDWEALLDRMVGGKTVVHYEAGRVRDNTSCEVLRRTELRLCRRLCFTVKRRHLRCSIAITRHRIYRHRALDLLQIVASQCQLHRAQRFR